MSIYKRHLNNTVKAILEKRGMQMTELAARMRERSKVNISIEHLSRIVNGHYIPSANIVLGIAEVLDLPVEDLFQLEHADELKPEVPHDAVS